MNKKEILVFSGILVLVLVFLFGVVFVFCGENNLKTVTDNKKNDEKITKNINKEVEEKYEDLRIYQDVSTSTWKTYYDKLYKIEFQHPLGWEVKTIENVVIGGNNHDLIISNEKTVLLIQLQKNISDSSFDTINKNNIIKNIITNNHVSFAASRNDGLKRYFYSYFFKIEDKFYRIFYHTIDLDYSIDITDVHDDEKSIVNNIINTIKFK